MTETTTIEIDFEVHKRIELERRSFSEPPNNALRRLLALGDPPKDGVSHGGQERAWSKAGVILPHGTELRLTYNGRTHTGNIEDGTWVVEGKRRPSPSGAATAVTGYQINGWSYWYVRRPGDIDWFLLSDLRVSEKDVKS